MATSTMRPAGVANSQAPARAVSSQASNTASGGKAIACVTRWSSVARTSVTPPRVDSGFSLHSAQTPRAEDPDSTRAAQRMLRADEITEVRVVERMAVVTKLQEHDTRLPSVRVHMSGFPAFGVCRAEQRMHVAADPEPPVDLVAMVKSFMPARDGMLRIQNRDGHIHVVLVANRGRDLRLAGGRLGVAPPDDPLVVGPVLERYEGMMEDNSPAPRSNSERNSSLLRRRDAPRHVVQHDDVVGCEVVALPRRGAGPFVLGRHESDVGLSRKSRKNGPSSNACRL